MTLITALEVTTKTGNCIVFGCDSRGRIGQYKTNLEQKVFPLNKYACILIAGDGEIGSELIQRFKEKNRKSLNGDTEKIAEQFSEFCKKTYSGLGNYQPHVSKYFPVVDFILAGLDKKGKNKYTPKIFILRSNSMFCHCRKKDYCVDGSYLIALYLLEKNYKKELSVDEAFKLVGALLYETNQIDTSVGGNLKIGIIDKDGFHMEPDSSKYITTWDEERMAKIIRE
jgi:20S proteasome alpha/beta subunit